MQHLDCSGMLCPFPILSAKAMIKAHGLPLSVTVTDLHAPIDFKVFCESIGVSVKEEQGDRFINLVLTRADEC